MAIDLTVDALFADDYDDISITDTIDTNVQDGDINLDDALIVDDETDTLTVEDTTNTPNIDLDSNIDLDIDIEDEVEVNTSELDEEHIVQYSNQIDMMDYCDTIKSNYSGLINDLQASQDKSQNIQPRLVSDYSTLLIRKGCPTVSIPTMETFIYTSLQTALKNSYDEESSQYEPKSQDVFREILLSYKSSLGNTIQNDIKTKYIDIVLSTLYNEYISNISLMNSKPNNTVNLTEKFIDSNRIVTLFDVVNTTLSLKEANVQVGSQIYTIDTLDTLFRNFTLNVEIPAGYGLYNEISQYITATQSGQLTISEDGSTATTSILTVIESFSWYLKEVASVTFLHIPYNHAQSFSLSELLRRYLLYCLKPKYIPDTDTTNDSGDYIDYSRIEECINLFDALDNEHPEVYLNSLYLTLLYGTPYLYVDADTVKPLSNLTEQHQSQLPAGYSRLNTYLSCIVLALNTISYQNLITLNDVLNFIKPIVNYMKTIVTSPYKVNPVLYMGITENEVEEDINQSPNGLFDTSNPNKFTLKYEDTLNERIETVNSPNCLFKFIVQHNSSRDYLHGIISNDNISYILPNLDLIVRIKEDFKLDGVKVSGNFEVSFCSEYYPEVSAISHAILTNDQHINIKANSNLTHTDTNTKPTQKSSQSLLRIINEYTNDFITSDDFQYNIFNLTLLTPDKTPISTLTVSENFEDNLIEVSRYQILRCENMGDDNTYACDGFINATCDSSNDTSPSNWENCTLLIDNISQNPNGEVSLPNYHTIEIVDSINNSKLSSDVEELYKHNFALATLGYPNPKLFNTLHNYINLTNPATSSDKDQTLSVSAIFVPEFAKAIQNLCNSMVWDYDYLLTRAKSFIKSNLIETLRCYKINMLLANTLIEQYDNLKDNEIEGFTREEVLTALANKSSYDALKDMEKEEFTLDSYIEYLNSIDMGILAISAVLSTNIKEPTDFQSQLYESVYAIPQIRVKLVELENCIVLAYLTFQSLKTNECRILKDYLNTNTVIRKLMRDLSNNELSLSNIDSQSSIIKLFQKQIKASADSISLFYESKLGIVNHDTKYLKDLCKQNLMTTSTFEVQNTLTPFKSEELRKAISEGKLFKILSILGQTEEYRDLCRCLLETIQEDLSVEDDLFKYFINYGNKEPSISEYNFLNTYNITTDYSSTLIDLYRKELTEILCNCIFIEARSHELNPAFVIYDLMRWFAPTVISNTNGKREYFTKNNDTSDLLSYANSFIIRYCLVNPSSEVASSDGYNRLEEYKNSSPDFILPNWYEPSTKPLTDLYSIYKDDDDE